MQRSDRTRVLIRFPLLIPLAIAAITAYTMATGTRVPAQRPAAELEVEMVSRLQRLSEAVLARNPGAIATLLDDSFTDELGRDKRAALTALTAPGSTPPLGYRPDREVYSVAPGRRSLTAKNTVRIFSQNARTHRVSAVDVTVTTDWVLTPSGWLLRHTHKPVRTAVQVEGVIKNARSGSPGQAHL
jgi:hypothetical protein